MSTTKRPTILLAEDEDGVRNFLAAMLSGSVVVIAAANGLEALNLYMQHPEIEMLISDIQMPHMNGVELAWATRKVNPELPILMISGQCSPNTGGDLQKLLDGHGTDFMEKPFLPTPFLTKVEQMLQLKR